MQNGTIQWSTEETKEDNLSTITWSIGTVKDIGMENIRSEQSAFSEKHCSVLE